MITENPCVACGACVCKCPAQCITLQKNETGYYSPEIDKANCTGCNACVRVCPANGRKAGISWEQGTYYAAWDKNAQNRLQSSSGGMFGIMAAQVLEAGGIVFGAAYSDDCRSVRQTSTEHVALQALKKSKYVESYTGHIFVDVKAALNAGRMVLYCGTACQIDGLVNYLGKEYENLITCDFLCHGVPGVGVYEKYVDNLQKKYGKIHSIDFRSKKYGWKTYCTYAVFESGKNYLKTRFQDPYLRLFFENAVLRDACYDCRRTNSSNADFTIGDFWRVKETSIQDTNQGISIVGVHTVNGREFWDRILKAGACEVARLEPAQYAYAYTRSTKKPADREKQLQIIRQTDDLFRLPVDLGTKVRGIAYHMRGILGRMTG